MDDSESSLKSQWLEINLQMSKLSCLKRFSCLFESGASLALDLSAFVLAGGIMGYRSCVTCVKFSGPGGGIMALIQGSAF